MVLVDTPSHDTIPLNELNGLFQRVSVMPVCWVSCTALLLVSCILASSASGSALPRRAAAYLPEDYAVSKVRQINSKSATALLLVSWAGQLN
jgi:hypothetical protein